jgi:hypothetical protein
MMGLSPSIAFSPALFVCIPLSRETLIKRKRGMPERIDLEGGLALTRYAHKQTLPPVDSGRKDSGGRDDRYTLKT